VLDVGINWVLVIVFLHLIGKFICVFWFSWCSEVGNISFTGQAILSSTFVQVINSGGMRSKILLHGFILYQVEYFTQ